MTVVYHVDEGRNEHEDQGEHPDQGAVCPRLDNLLGHSLHGCRKKLREGDGGKERGGE